MLFENAFTDVFKQFFFKDGGVYQNGGVNQNGGVYQNGGL
jgi:hypothetical protein